MASSIDDSSFPRARTGPSGHSSTSNTVVHHSAPLRQCSHRSALLFLLRFGFMNWNTAEGLSSPLMLRQHREEINDVTTST
jgi:hypothetical protein